MSTLPTPRNPRETDRPAAAPGTSAAGVISLVLMLVSVVGSVASFYVVGSKWAAYAIANAVDITKMTPSDPVPAELAQQLGPASLVWQLSLGLGLTGLVLALVAIVQRRGRLQGVATLVTAVVGLVLTVAVMMVAMWPAVAVLA